MMKKNSVKILRQVLSAVIEEAEHNPDFSAKLELILNATDATDHIDKKQKDSLSRRTGNRRDPAILDPVLLVAENEAALVEKLHELTEKELKDIVAEYGMDQSKLAMKWKDKERLINLIVEAAHRRASKGDAFRVTD